MWLHSNMLPDPKIFLPIWSPNHCCYHQRSLGETVFKLILRVVQEYYVLSKIWSALYQIYDSNMISSLCQIFVEWVKPPSCVPYSFSALCIQGANSL